jgi:hypothetical protein
MRRLILIAALAVLGCCLALITLAIAGHTPKAGGLSQAIVGTDDALYILRAHKSNDPLYFWRCPINEATYFDEPLTGLLGAEARARGVFQNGTALAWDGERYIYALVGGFYEHRGRKGFWRYDTCIGQLPDCEKRWSQLADTPGEQGAGDALAFVKQGESAYVYALVGAATKERSGAYNGFSRYDVALNNWKELPKPWDCTDDGAALAWDGGHYLYALRGSNCRDDATQDFARFDLTAQTPSWETMSSIPEPMDDGGSLIWDGGRYLYAITGGGGEVSDGKGFYRFDLQLLK